MSKSTVEPLAVAVKVTVRPPLDPVTLSDTGGDAQWCRRVVWQRCAAPVVPVERAETGVTHNTDAPRAPTTMAIPIVRRVRAFTTLQRRRPWAPGFFGSDRLRRDWLDERGSEQASRRRSVIPGCVGYPMPGPRLAPEATIKGWGRGGIENRRRESQPKPLVSAQRVLTSFLVDWFESCSLTSTELTIE